MSKMYVIKRDGRKENVFFDKITQRVTNMCWDLNMDFVDPVQISQKVVQGLYAGVTTEELDKLAAETAASYATHHPDFNKLAARIEISNLQKKTTSSFSTLAKQLVEYIHPITNEPAPLLSEKVFGIIQENAERIDQAINYDRDFDLDYFGFMTLCKSYLLRMHDQIAERPQHMFMRVALGIHMNDIDAALETYDMMSQKYFIHATPTLFNAGTPHPQMSSCFLLTMKDDSIGGIFDTLKNCATISKHAGGIGLSIHNIRAEGSYIRGTNGKSNGIVPMLRVFNETSRYVDQCFLPSTPIFTEQGMHPIGSIVAGDRVLNANGVYDTVESVHTSSYSGTMCQLNIRSAMEPVVVTQEHLVLVLRNQKRRLSYDVIRKRLDANRIRPEYVAAKDLTPDDMVAFPIPNQVADIPSLSTADLRMIGIMIGDGHVSQTTMDQYVALDATKKQDVADFVMSYLDSKLVRYGIHDVGRNTMRYTWRAGNGFPITRAMIYSQSNDKQVHPTLLNLGVDKCLALVRGILETDGCIRGKATSELTLEMASQNVIRSVRHLLLRCGILTSGYARNRVGEEHTTKYGDTIRTTKPTWVLRIPRHPILCEALNIEPGKFRKVFRYKDMLFSRINTIEHCQVKDQLVIDLRMTNQDTPSYVTDVGVAHNGGGKRKGSFAIYLEPWHADIERFLELKKNHGKEEHRARDLFYALWIPDLFMERVKADASWSLFCPNEAPGLFDVHSDAFRVLYTKYEATPGLAKKTMKARDLWYMICRSQIETGVPYMMYKDACNAKSNQQNLGTIRSSNLCTEIVEYTSPDEVAVCNLASINLSKFVKDAYTSHATYDFEALERIAQIVTKNLNRVIDQNFYPVEEAYNSNMRHRPIGIGVQAFADTLAMMRLPYESPKAKTLNKHIFETIYFGAVTASMELAKRLAPYRTFAGSPMSQGKFQFDLWNVKPTFGHDWETLRQNVIKHGVRNSLLVAPMPTASTSHILGNNECFEPFTSNMYARRVLAGEFTVVNKHMLRDLIEHDLWTSDIRNKVIAHGGSVQNIPDIPSWIKDLYKTVWEIKQKHVLDMAADRGPFICQSQSMNVHLAEPTFKILNSMHFYAWSRGLKTGMYYLRTRPKATAIQFTVDQQALQSSSGKSPPIEEEEECLMCGS